MLIKALCKNSSTDKYIFMYVNSENIVEIYPTMLSEISSYKTPIIYEGKRYFYMTTNSYLRLGYLYISEDDFNFLLKHNNFGNASR